MAGQPEHFGGVVLRIAEIATDGAGMSDDAVYHVTALIDAPLEVAAKARRGVSSPVERKQPFRPRWPFAATTRRRILARTSTSS